jgi:hypothetical protein
VTYKEQTDLNKRQINDLTRTIIDGLKAIQGKNPGFRFRYTGFTARLKNHLSAILTDNGMQYPGPFEDQAGRPSADRVFPDSDTFGMYPRMISGISGLIDNVEDASATRDWSQGQPTIDDGDLQRALTSFDTARTPASRIEYQSHFVRVSGDKTIVLSKPALLIGTAPLLADGLNYDAAISDTTPMNGEVVALFVVTATATRTRLTRDQYREPVAVPLTLNKGSQMYLYIGNFRQQFQTRPLPFNP